MITKGARLSVRLSPEIRRELEALAQTLGGNISTQVDQMIRFALPTFKERAKQLNRRTHDQAN